MKSNMLEYLEKTAERVPERIAFYDEREELSYGNLKEVSRRIGTALLKIAAPKKTVALFLDARSIRNIPAIYGVLYAGCAYAPLDISMPPERLLKLLSLLDPGVVLADEKGRRALQDLELGEVPVLPYEEAAKEDCDREKLELVRRKISIYDPMSILYTSGSTGIPKGSIQTHFSYLHWTEATIEVYGFDEKVVFGNQSPFFYANSIIDIFPPVALGATVYLLPSGILNFPKKFMECLNRNRISELTMTPSSFITMVKAGVVEEGSLPWLRYGIMSGESMPWEPLKIWMDASPGADWWHFYGSTEMFSVAVGKVGGQKPKDPRLPVGKLFSKVHVLFMDEDGNEVPFGEPGELFVSSPWIAAGYYRDEIRTEEFWSIDPLKRGWYERFYRSGDMGYLREDGQMVILGRRDTQIKHMGYRMELGEVEAALRAVQGGQEVCVLFQKDTGKIWCFYTGTLSERELRKEMKTRLPGYMLPDVFVHLEEMPYTASMKLDRSKLRDMMSEKM